ncbi:hypothetical protein SAMD00019534_112380 [Acytostelium subglobosum LB1]|uniref:hypothetical protein n=1 Tax=Acytostelium subglobosum LB1 TaxID=1410327 RepID=UPI000644BEBA|nr:hypothetical protein SAMD00019534_112380 [Acytostelium subglobosum LB1]GAM28062.1 hypothetical protein SAMD00019534_112380 [Acytostelium subglobosum LB1]|eukprot:XP_012749021.1 hypothetical protein SAMD00019534_112380 [Acytostelium subglobosum LB1]
MAYNFVSTVQKPTAVTHTATGNFTAHNERNLVVGKATKIEIFTLTAEGLKPVLDVSIYGRIASMKMFLPPGEKQEQLFILTEKYRYCILGYSSERKELITVASGNAEGAIGRPAEAGQIGIVDPDCGLIGLHLYEGLLRVVPFNRETNKYGDSFIMRLEQLQVIDMVFLHNCPKPTIAILSKDTRDARHLSTYIVDLQQQNKELIDGPWTQDSVDDSSNMLIALPNGGLLVVGEVLITYMSAVGKSSVPSVTIGHTRLTTYEQVDKDRYLFADDAGYLYLLILVTASSTAKNKDISSMKWEPLGETSIASSLSYLDSGVVYIGSASGDSQLISLCSEKDPETDSYIRVLEHFTNLGPILDFCVVDMEKQGQGQLVTCSGTFQDGSLRIVTNGIGIAEQASIELAGIRGLWALSSGSSGDMHRYLILSFINSTKVLAFSGEDIEETEIAGFDCNAPTLYIGNPDKDHYLQIATTGIYLVNSSTLMRADLYKPKGSINLASCNGKQILISQGNNLIYIEIQDQSLVVVKETQLQYEISCLDISLLDGFDKATMCAVGLWTDISVRLLSLPTLTEVYKETLGGEILPRSLMFITFEGINHLLCTLGDGHLFNFTLDLDTSTLNERKKISLGTTPVLLSKFKLKNNVNVFASSDRPTVIYSSNKKLLYSVVNMKVASHVCSFNSEAFNDCIAIATDTSLSIGKIDDIQRLHIRTVPLGEMARRITYIEENQCYGVITIRRSDNDPSQVQNNIKLLNSQTFDCMSKFELQELEYGWSIVTCRFKTESDALFLVVGTAFHSEKDMSKGRILVFKIDDNKLFLVHELPLMGCAYCLLPFNGRLLAGINKRVQLFGWDAINNKLTADHVYNGQTLSIHLASHGHFVLVADLMKSMTLLCEEPSGGIKEIARNPQPLWPSRVEMIDDENFIGGDNSYNLLVVQKNDDATSEVENSLLDSVGHFHLGEQINRFAHGSFVTIPDLENTKIPTILFATVSGAIGVIASITKEDYEFFEQLQKGLNKVIQGVGRLSHEDWRSFSTEHLTQSSRNFIDGDLIEMFMDLRHDKMLEAIKDMDVSIEDTYRKIESIMQHIR